ncbi:hypothetical protein, partial [Sutterella wadsworthensis]|uniref:hypothetical protein n=1 Tax=Sutterella wadsworthensis TaxID=40545 RepID=UPI003974A1E4
VFLTVLGYIWGVPFGGFIKKKKNPPPPPPPLAVKEGFLFYRFEVSLQSQNAARNLTISYCCEFSDVA